MPRPLKCNRLLTISAHQSSYVTTVTTTTTETVSAPPPSPPPAAATTTATTAACTWKAKEIRRLCQLPLDSDDPAPARVEACIANLENRVTDMLGDEDVEVSEEEDSILEEIRRCEGQG